MQNENETWCSDFTKWVWQQAGVTADMNTLNAGAEIVLRVGTGPGRGAEAGLG